MSWGSSSSALAQQAQDPALLLEAHCALGLTLFCLGDLVLARAHLEQGIALYDPQQHPPMPFSMEYDPGVVGLSYVAWALWCLAIQTKL